MNISKIKVGDTTYDLKDADARIKLNGIEEGAQVHKAPTSAEVKSALGTEYKELTVGNIVGEFSDNNAEFIYRPTAGAVDIESGKADNGAKIESIKGNTIAWNQLNVNNDQYVDMGLPSGILWAKSNIDVSQPTGFAASPFQYDCSFFSWGNTEGHNPISTTAFDYDFGVVNSETPWYDGQVYGGTQGNILTGNIPANESFDAARANIGSVWRIPTSNEFKELFDNCDFIDANGDVIADSTNDKFVTVNGVLGFYLKSKNNGNRIFFACSGYGDGSSWNNRGSSGQYWSASFYSARYAWRLLFYGGSVYPHSDTIRSNGLAVRPVIQPGVSTGKGGHKYFVKDNNIMDLTLIYGAGNEPSTVAEFEEDYFKWFGKPLTYEAYDAGSLKPVMMSGLKTVGFNQLDKDSVTVKSNGYINGTNGNIVNFANHNCTESYIKVIAGSQYELYSVLDDSFSPPTPIGAGFYDADYNFVEGFLYELPITKSKVFTVPSNACYLRFSFDPPCQISDICLHLVHSGHRNGEYEHYWTSLLNVPVTTVTGKLNGEGNSVVVFPDGMKSAGTVYDEVVRRGSQTIAIKRVGSVDLGTLDYLKMPYYDGDHRFISSYEDGINAKYTIGIYNSNPCICSKYTSSARASGYNMADKTIAVLKWTEGRPYGSVNIADSSYSSSTSSDLAALKASLDGVMLYYELKEPEEYILDNFELPQIYDVDDYGTEQIINTAGSDGIAPILNIKYGINAADTIKNLPHYYVSAKGEQSFTETQKARARRNIGIDIAEWAKQLTKPNYTYSEIGYTANATSSVGGTLSLDGTTPLHIVTLTGNVSALTLSANPSDGHSCHVIFTAAAEQNVVIAHDSTNRICPDAEDISLTIPAGGYVEIDFLNANNKVFVRGV